MTFTKYNINPISSNNKLANGYILVKKWTTVNKKKIIGNDINGYKDKDVELFLNKYWEKKYPKPFNDK